MEKYQTFSARFWALTLDSILLLPLGILQELIKSAEYSENLKWILFFIVNLAEIIYFIVMHGLFGQTVGKMLAKVKVLDVSEAPIKFRQAVLRDAPQLLFTVCSYSFLYPLTPADIQVNSIALWKIPFLFLILAWGVADLVVFFTNDKRRALHDYIAGTVVVRINQDSDAR
ncbi:MAG TPA: RDD family protein [Pyrinomonadaceae bacterium]|jgi:uncharacterized RDD family membrane protein YckC